jgi:SAM-dependent methyltransferase
MGMLDMRVVAREQMDDPALEEDLHAQALRGLARLNLLSATAALFWKPLRRLLEERGRLRVLDLACGGGDVTLALRRRAGSALEIEGCDKSPTALEHARAQAHRRGAEVRFFEHDVLEGELPGGYDLYICSLFLHHLEEGQAVDLLARMARADALLVHDLARCGPGLLLSRLVPPLITRSRVVHGDAVLSVRNAFTPGEIGAMAERAGLDGVRVSRHWPYRFLISWRRAWAGPTTQS